jgi:hypothetical protein
MDIPMLRAAFGSTPLPKLVQANPIGALAVIAIL